MIISKENFNKIIDKNITRFLIIEKSISSNLVFFFSSRRRHTRLVSDWSSDVCSSDLRYRSGRSRCLRPAERAKELCPGFGGLGLLSLSSYAHYSVNPCRRKTPILSLRRLERLAYIFDWGQIGRASCRERGVVTVGVGN